MKQFALIHSVDQETITGSDQFIPLDGRLNIFNAIKHAKKSARRVLELRSDVYSVRVYKGDLRHNVAVSGYHVISK